MSAPQNPTRSERTIDAAIEVRVVDPRSDLAAVVLDDLEREYDLRYGDIATEPASAEITRYPAERFVPPDGVFLVLLRESVVVAGGAFMRLDQNTAEFKRIWTHPGHRRQGLSRTVLDALERAAADLGYTRVFLTTGPRQPEAVALYDATGYERVDPPAGDHRGVHAFAKSLVAG
ncbi:GNAT family N-acetyltransferase [Curtobacterium ammoniigenes]|uniref:GNAT family N-acetyltransferase n=1 Tax=Curtobacterium ammoniigenes TaxID=395387 RepID=UPI000833A70E|nr:GNAT family N-acetyltransferase [Curtobacterium ammoniigenes]